MFKAMDSFSAYTSNLLKGFQKETSRAKTALEEELIKRELSETPVLGDATFDARYQMANLRLKVHLRFRKSARTSALS